MITEIEANFLRVHIMKRGLHRSQTLKTFRPHQLDDADKFYRDLLGEGEYEKLKKPEQGFFKACMSREIFAQFLDEEQRKKYRGNDRRRRAAFR